MLVEEFKDVLLCRDIVSIYANIGRQMAGMGEPNDMNGRDGGDQAKP